MNNSPSETTKTPVSLGIIGAGRISQLFHVSHYAANSGCRIVAICDSRAELRDAVADKYRIEQRFDHHGDMLNNAALDAVVVVAPRQAMGSVVMESLPLVRGVLSEKPIAFTRDQASRLVACAQTTGTAYAVGFMKRHDPGVKKCLEVFRAFTSSHIHGALVHVRCHDFCAEYAVERDDYISTPESRPARLQEWALAPEWLPARLTGDYEWFVNVVTHDLNLLRLFLGECLQPVRLHVQPDRGCMVMMEANDVPVSLSAGKAAIGCWDQALTFYFERARLTLTLPSPMSADGTAKTELSARNGGDGEIRPNPDDPVAFAAQANNFVSHLATGEPLLGPATDALADMALVENIWTDLA